MTFTTSAERSAIIARHLERLRREYERDHFPAFMRRVFSTVNPGTRFVPGWHLDLLAERLEACRTGQVRRLIINAGPRSLKSLIASVALPAFALGHNPAARILCASHSQALATKLALDCRAVLQSPWYQRLFKNTQLSREQNEKDRFMTTMRGARLSMAVGGGLTGEGGGLLILDDPQTPESVRSAGLRAQVNDWFEQSFATRMDDAASGVMIVVMQRLHAQDLTAHLMARGGWEQLVLPAIAPRPTWFHIQGRAHLWQEGEPLQPARLDRPALEEIRMRMGSQAFAAQYLQAPTPDDGALVRRAWISRFDLNALLMAREEGACS